MSSATEWRCLLPDASTKGITNIFLSEIRERWAGWLLVMASFCAFCDNQSSKEVMKDNAALTSKSQLSFVFLPRLAVSVICTHWRHGKAESTWDCRIGDRQMLMTLE
jgi:hypothetical protein